jgi:hypothetical protein
MELAQYHVRFQTLDSRFADDEFHSVTSAVALQIPVTHVSAGMLRRLDTLIREKDPT